MTRRGLSRLALLGALPLRTSIAVGQQEPDRLPPPAGLKARKSAFEARNSPVNVARLGREFFALTFLPNWGPREFERPGRWGFLSEVRSRLAQADYLGALDAFKISTLRKLRDPEAHGLTNGVSPQGSPDPVTRSWSKPLFTPGHNSAVLARAQDLMNHIVTAGDKRIHIGEPGTVNWKYVSNYSVDSASVPRVTWENWPWHIATFSPLLDAYLLTGNRAYIDKWAGFADDWAMNQIYGVNTVEAYNIPDTWSGGAEASFALIRYLAGISSDKSGGTDLPATTFARVMLRLVRDYVPLSRMYFRSNPQNWTEHSIATMFELAFLLDEYRAAPLYLREARRRLELLATTRHMPDGTDSELNVGYNFAYLTAASLAVHLWKLRISRVPASMAPEWERSQREEIDTGALETEVRELTQRRARFLAGHLTSNGEWPIGGARADHRNRAKQTFETLAEFAAETLKDPQIARILSVTRKQGGPEPNFTSEWFPYAGYRYIRAGWKSEDPYLFMISSPKPFLGNLSARDNNAIGLGAFGMDLLVSGDVGPYTQNRSPVLVDGKEQFFHAGIPRWGHRHYLVTAGQKPAQCRWHDSAHFTVTEGSYSGPYGAGAADEAPAEQARANREALRGVTHDRLIHYVRDAGLWIVVDRLQSAQEHEFAQEWRLPLQPSKYPAFTSDQIEVQSQRRAIQTNSPATPNISLFQFASQGLRYSKNVEEIDTKASYRLCNFCRISASWRARGTSALVTAIYPRRSAQDQLASITAIPPAPGGAEGFEARTPAGLHVRYLSAVVSPSTLSLGTVTVEGESLLLLTSPHGITRGVVLGCASMAVNGHNQVLSISDFEFELADGGVRNLTPILRPIEPVEISPRTDLFVAEHVVALSCATPDVQIRYTLDRSEPTATSPLYTDPLAINKSVEIKARAFRNGTVTVPDTMSGTCVTPASVAVFTKARLLNPMAGIETEPGLDYSYYEGNWQRLFMGLDQMTPMRTGQTRRLFEISPGGKARPFAVTYSGFLDVPAEGIYSFHAPRESYMPNIVAGYDLRVFVAGREWYPATKAHGLGTWSIALRKGLHAFQVTVADFRGDAPQRINQREIAPYIWDGSAPALQISGPGLYPQPVPLQMLARERKQGDRQTARP